MKTIFLILCALMTVSTTAFAKEFAIPAGEQRLFLNDKNESIIVKCQSSSKKLNIICACTENDYGTYLSVTTIENSGKVNYPVEAGRFTHGTWSEVRAQCKEALSSNPLCSNQVGTINLE